MSLKNRTGVEVLTLKDLTSAEVDELAYELRYQDAEFAEYDRQVAEEAALTDKMFKAKTHVEISVLLHAQEEKQAARPPSFPERRELTLTMSAEDALAELHQAEREGRLLIEWKRGWLYFFYCPFTHDPDGEFEDFDMHEFLTRVSRPTKIHRQHHGADLKL